MNMPLASSSRLRSTLPTIILAVLCFYFAFYLLFGPRGILALGRVDDRLHDHSAQYHELKDKREQVEADVNLMRPDSLDADMAEEQARRALGYTKPDEIVIHLN